MRVLVTSLPFLLKKEPTTEKGRRIGIYITLNKEIVKQMCLPKRAL